MTERQVGEYDWWKSRDSVDEMGMTSCSCLPANGSLLRLNHPQGQVGTIKLTLATVARLQLCRNCSNLRWKRFGSSQNRSHMGVSAFLTISTFAAAAALAIPLLAFVAWGLSLAMQPTWVVRWAQKHWPNVLFMKSTRAPIVALTIDDGPHKDITPELLKILKENNCRATWFIIGSNLDECPDLVAQIHSEGHEVGNHTMYDLPSWRLPPEEFESQLLAVDRRLDDYYFKDNNGRQIKWFRPMISCRYLGPWLKPSSISWEVFFVEAILLARGCREISMSNGWQPVISLQRLKGHGFFTKKMLQITEAHGFRTALGSLFPLDTLFTNQGEHIAKYLLWRIQSGAIIILHDRGPQKVQTAKALRILLPNLKKRGFSVVTLSELLDLKTDTVKPIGS